MARLSHSVEGNENPGRRCGSSSVGTGSVRGTVQSSKIMAAQRAAGRGETQPRFPSPKRESSFPLMEMRLAAGEVVSAEVACAATSDFAVEVCRELRLCSQPLPIGPAIPEEPRTRSSVGSGR